MQKIWKNFIVNIHLPNTKIWQLTFCYIGFIIYLFISPSSYPSIKPSYICRHFTASWIHQYYSPKHFSMQIRSQSSIFVCSFLNLKWNLLKTICTNFKHVIRWVLTNNTNSFHIIVHYHQPGNVFILHFLFSLHSYSSFQRSPLFWLFSIIN